MTNVSDFSNASDFSVDDKLAVFQELIACSDNLSCWHYDSDGQLRSTNCPDLFFHNIFLRSGCHAHMMEYAKEHTEPLLLTSAPGLMWAAAFERIETSSSSVYVKPHLIGPVSNSDTSLSTIERTLRKSDIPVSWKNNFVKKMQTLPIISTTNFYAYTLMLHYCLTGEQLLRSDIQFQQGGIDLSSLKDPAEKKDRHKTWMAEQALVRMVREGNLNYKDALSHTSTVSEGVRVNVGDALLRAKISNITFITICVRAAIEGGLSPELAYSKGDAYLQSLMECSRITEASYIGHTMYDDFIHCVHKLRANPSLSRQIQSCCDYISMHIEEKLSIADMAKRVGYTEYYLSRKFKSETGQSMSEYIKNAKIEHAKMLLTTTGDGIQEISERLHFCSRSYFSDIFRKLTGLSPAEYREQTQRM